MILIALGANLPGPDGHPPIETCRRAVSGLASLRGLRLATVSRWYRTTPVPPSDQPDFVNGVAALDGEIDPAALLAGLHAIEDTAGRNRSTLNAARTLDLDIIDLNGMLRDAPDPILPHPRAHQRAFVLIPLRDAAPGWIHPRLGHTVDRLIASLALKAADLAPVE